MRIGTQRNRELVRDRYEPLRLVAAGGQGELWQALDHLHGRLVALKIRPMGAQPDEILREARTLLAMTPHPRLPVLREDFVLDGTYHLVMDWVEGSDLSSVLARGGGPGLGLDAVVASLDDVASALDHLHTHDPPVVHRDVKPSNILLTAGRGAVLVDLGLSGAEGRADGTRGYIAPELFDGASATPASDIYALGVTAFVLLTGSPPGPGAGAALDDRLRSVLGAALAIDPERRPARASGFVDLLAGRPHRTSVRPPEGDAITFVFTDIEGSTRLFHELGDGFLPVLHEHNRIVRTAMEGRGGYVVKTEGDSFFCAFASARDAIAACLDAQTELDVPVRMGIHTGEARVVSDDYIGLAVHEASRVASAANGGQVVVSAATHDAAGDLPDGAALEDLGLHELRDFPEPRRLYRLAHTRLATVDAPLRTARPTVHGLDAPPSPIVGRDDLIVRTCALLTSDARLVTLTGPGGIGKTRLAVELAGRLRGSFEAAWFVPLADLRDPSRLEAAIAEVVVPAGPASPAEELGRVPSLLVLDNLEQIVEGTAVVAELLAACPRLRVLATSRERLRVRGEHVVDVPPLEDEAVELFAQRAGEIDDRDAAAELCRRLDGLPLAIELAAGRVRTFGVRGLLDELERGTGVLGTGDRDLPDRHRTLDATIAWSYELLTPFEADVFARLSVFAGGASLPAVRAVCGPDASEPLASLVDRSLVRSGSGHGGPRYTMLETIRVFASRRLADPTAVARAHAAWFVGWAERAEAELTGPDQVRWYSLVSEEHQNLLAALDAVADDADASLRMCASLGRFWAARGRIADGRARLERALALDGGSRAARARASIAAGHMAMATGDVPGASRHLDHALAWARADGAPGLVGAALNQLGELARARGDLAAAGALYAEASDAMHAAGDVRGTGLVLINQGGLAMNTGDGRAARERYVGALDRMRETGDVRSVANVLNMLGSISVRSGELDAGEAYLTESIAVLREIKDRSLLAVALQNLGVLGMERDDGALMTAALEESLEINREIGNRRGVAEGLANLGYATEQQDPGRSRAYFAQSLAVARSLTHEPHAAAVLIQRFGAAAARRGDLLDAQAQLADAAGRLRALGDKENLASALQGLGDVLVRMELHGEARPVLEEALGLWESLGDEGEVAACRVRLERT